MSNEYCSNECLRPITEKNPLVSCLKCEDDICTKCSRSDTNGGFCWSCSRHFIYCEVCKEISAHPDVYTCSEHMNRICHDCATSKKCLDGCSGVISLKEIEESDEDVEDDESDEDDEDDEDVEDEMDN